MNSKDMAALAAKGAQPVVKAEMHITMMDDGSVMVNGPIHNKLLCYGLLECVKEIISDQQPKVIEPVSAEMMRAVAGKRND
jgi:uncharacterized protein (UPF0147 family)